MRTALAAPPPDDPDPRTEGVVCGLTKTTATGEWVCVAAPHDTEKQRTRQPSRYGYAAKSERHYYVKRWPYRGEA